MKRYTKPSVQSFEFFVQKMLASSGGVQDGGNVVNRFNENDITYSRQHHGIGSGLWEDMK